MTDYNFYYWGPLLFKIKIQPEDLKKCADLCSKQSSLVNDTLAGAIKHEHYVSPNAFVKIITPYLNSFGHAYQNWYGKTIHQTNILMAWVNFMRAGEFNPPHTHPDCDLSSVLFIKIPEALKEECKKFTGTGSGPGTLSFTYGEFQPHIISNRFFFPEEGDLFIFPATLTHFVTPFMSEGERISMSANFSLQT